MGAALTHLRGSNPWALVSQAGASGLLGDQQSPPPKVPMGLLPPKACHPAVFQVHSSALSLCFLPQSLPPTAPQGKGGASEAPGVTEDPNAQLFPEGSGEPPEAVEQGGWRRTELGMEPEVGFLRSWWSLSFGPSLVRVPFKTRSRVERVGVSHSVFL